MKTDKGDKRGEGGTEKRREETKCNQCNEKIAKIMIDVDCLIGSPDAPREKRSKWRRHLSTGSDNQ